MTGGSEQRHNNHEAVALQVGSVLVEFKYQNWFPNFENGTSSKPVLIHVHQWTPSKIKKNVVKVNPGKNSSNI